MDTTRPAHYARALPFLAALAVMAGLFAVSSVPGDGAADPSAIRQFFDWFPPLVQNLFHLPGYALLAWTLFYCVLPRAGAGLRAFALVVALAAGYGVLMEWHQTGIPGRHASGMDVMLNITGAAVGWLLASRYARRRRAPGIRPDGS